VDQLRGDLLPGGGDNPAFVIWMHAWFAAHATELAYEAYYSNCGAGGVQSCMYTTRRAAFRTTVPARRTERCSEADQPA
jgi:hypothetical protein